MTKCVSFVFHHRSSGGEVEPVKENKTAKEKRKFIDEDGDYENYEEESDNSDDEDYDGKN